jgi:hypothetical protein
MILLQSVVQIAARPVLHFASQYPAYRTRIRVAPISGYAGWFVANYFRGSFEELLGSNHISVLGKHRVYQVAVSVYGSVQIAPFSVNCKEKLRKICNTALRNT